VVTEDQAGTAPAGRTAAPASRPGPLGTVSGGEFALFVAAVRDYAILMLDASGRVVSWNAGARNIKGYEADEILGRSFEVFYVAEDRERGLPAQHLAAAAAAGSLQYEGWRLRKDGSRFWAEVLITAVFDDDGRLRGFGKVTRDVTERRRAEERLTHRTLHDVLTGLPNRELLLDRIGQGVAATNRHHATVAVFFIDLDRFKVINDTFGHAAGDHALVTVARRLQTTVRPEDTVARLSGDEFVVVCPDLKQSVEAQLVGERITSALADPVPFGAEHLAVHASVGVAVTDDPGTDPETLLRDADTAMYDAKRDGRGQSDVSVFSPEMGTRLTRRLDVESALRHAVAAGEMSVVYQPVIRMDGGQIESFEALLRWHRPHEIVDPVEFIPLAEQTGLIIPIGAWVLEQACRQAVRWDEEGPGGVAPRIAVNVSARQLHNGGLVAVLDRVLSDTRIEASRVCLEVTETQLMSDAVASIEVLRDLKRRGISLSIDDFGTGYSSLSHLKRLPVDTVKIDRSFVAGLGESTTGREDSAIVGATIRMAQALGLAVVAEGVETPQQYDELRGLGCDYGQGWLFGRPEPPGTYGGGTPATTAPSPRRGPAVAP
jgi:diguanylate cyclase (GGDEF)-like protein/PAS domain S-box-containing protein